MKQIEHYKVGFVKNAANEADNSFMWVCPIRELGSTSGVKDVEVFEDRVTQVFADSFSELGDSEKPEFVPGDIVVVQHNNSWVRGEIISAAASCQEADDDSKMFTIFLVDHALIVKRPLNMCKPIPENIIAPKVRFSFLTNSVQIQYQSYLSFRRFCLNDWNFALDLFPSWNYLF